MVIEFLCVFVGLYAGLGYGATGLVVDGGTSAPVAKDFEVIHLPGGQAAEDGLLFAIGDVLVPGVGADGDAVHGVVDGFKTRGAHPDQVSVGQDGPAGVFPLQGDGVGRKAGDVEQGLLGQSAAPDEVYVFRVIDKGVAVALDGIHHVVAVDLLERYRVAGMPLQQQPDIPLLKGRVGGAIKDCSNFI